MKKIPYFNEISYKRLDYDKTKEQMGLLINKLKESSSFEEYLMIFKQIIEIQNEIEEMYDYADIRNMRDSQDEYFEQEITYWNEYKTKFDLLFSQFYELCLKSKYKEELSRYVPDNFFRTIECQLKITSDEIIDLKQKEAELKAEYKKIVNLKVSYDGEEKNLPFISGLFTNKDRSIRKKAHDTINDFYYRNQKQLDQIFYELVSVRNEIAHKLGFSSYCEYSLYKLRRFGYDYTDISKFRNNMIQYINPLCKKLGNWKKEQLKLETIEYFDTIFFEDMPDSIYSGKDLLNAFGDTFKKFDTELYAFYKEMLDKGYIDLENRNNKVNFSITNYLTKTCLPTITGNYKNSYLDIQATSHEMGHAYQKYNASIMDENYIVSALLKYPTFEIAEMFSFAMELISLNYLDNLLDKDNYKKYCFMKIYNLVSMLPYICLVDEFQEQIYTRQNLKEEDMRMVWLELVNKYGLEVSNKGHINLESGGYFYRQNHIFLDPFYYIDYALSYFGAFSIANACKENLDLFKEIGSVASYYAFDKLIKEYNMPNPFDEETVANIAIELEDQLTRLYDYMIKKEE